MTRSMSAASATSSMMAVEGVSGEIATPAFILRAWIASMSESGSAVNVRSFQHLTDAGTCAKHIEQT